MEPQQVQPESAMPPPEPTQPMPEINSMPPQKGGKGWMIIAVIAILLLIVTAILGFVRYNSVSAKVSELNSQISAAQAQVKELTTAATAATLIKITEMGIQISRPNDAKEAFYFVNKNAEGNQVASFSSPALQILAAQNPSTPPVNNACGLNSAPLGTITQVKAGTVIKGVKVEEVKNTELIIVKKQDADYYIYNAPTTQCSTVKAVQDLQLKQAKALQESFNTSLATLAK